MSEPKMIIYGSSAKQKKVRFFYHLVVKLRNSPKSPHGLSAIGWLTEPQLKLTMYRYSSRKKVKLLNGGLMC